jgi:hypothetical protein
MARMGLSLEGTIYIISLLMGSAVYSHPIWKVRFQAVLKHHLSLKLQQLMPGRYLIKQYN